MSSFNDDSIEIRLEHDAGPLLVLKGEFDLLTVDRLTAGLAAAMAEGTPRISLDMTGVGFFDSTSLAALLSANRQLQARGGTLVVSRASLAVRRVLEVTGLTSTFGLASVGESDGAGTD
jgi:anti-anti-sigma factor